MGIPDAVVLYVVCILLSILTALLTSALRLFAFGRRCRRLELRCDDIEDRQASVKGKQLAKQRWDPETWIQQDKTSTPASINTPASIKKREYDNDPMV